MVTDVQFGQLFLVCIKYDTGSYLWVIQKKSHCSQYIIYNSVLTCRQNIIYSSASAPLNATKIAVKKVSDVDACMFGPEF